MARLFTFFLLLFPAFIGLWMSTQAFAARISYNLKFLGSPLFSTDSMMVFSPFRYLTWWGQYYQEAPDLFTGTCAPAVLGVAISLIGMFLCRPEKELTSHGTARWAKQSELSKMDLQSAHGCVVGLNDTPFVQWLTSVLSSLEEFKNKQVGAAETAFDQQQMKKINVILNNVAKIRARVDSLSMVIENLEKEIDLLPEGSFKYKQLSTLLADKKHELATNQKTITLCNQAIEKQPKFKPSWEQPVTYLSVKFYDWFLSFYKRVPHRYLRDDSNKHLAVIAPTRSGKGVGLIIPTLLGGWNESCVVNDIKSENWGITAGYRKKMGQKVIKFEPTASDGSSARWNPLDEIPIGTELEVSAAQNIAAVIADFEGKGGNGDHWVANAANVIMAVILHLKYAHLSQPDDYPDEPNLYTVASFLKVSVNLTTWKKLCVEEAKKVHSQELISVKMSEVDQQAADDEALAELDGLSIADDVLPVPDTLSYEPAPTVDLMAQYLTVTDGQAAIKRWFEEDLAHYVELMEKKYCANDAHGFVDTIRNMNAFPHVPKDGIDYKYWDSKSESFLVRHITPADLKKLYPKAASLSNEKYQYTHPIILQAFKEISSKPDNELGSIVSTANTALKEYLDPVLSANTSVSDFCINDLMNFRLPVSLYLVTPPSDLLRLAPIFRLFFEMMVRVHAREIGTYHNGRVKSIYKHKCLLLMDEFSSLGNLKSFASTLSYIAGYGMKAFLINQGMPQITGIYGKDNPIEMNCHLKIFYAPNDNDTGKAAEAMLGNRTILVKSRSENSSTGFFSRTSYSYSEQARALMTADEMKRMGDHEILLPTGFPPVFTWKIKYYQSNFFLDKLCDAPVVSDVIRDSIVNEKTFPKRFEKLRLAQKERAEKAKKENESKFSFLHKVSPSDFSADSQDASHTSSKVS